MADTNTQTTEQVAQPMQQEPSALERAKMADTRQVITLDAEAAYDELELFGTQPGEYREDSPVQGEYWRFKFRGAICTVSPEFKEAYDSGNLLSITASPTVFTVTKADPNNAGKKMEQVGYGYSLSYSDLAKKQKAQKAKLAAKELGLKAQVQELKMEKKLEAIKAADFKVVLTEDEMQELMGAI